MDDEQKPDPSLRKLAVYNRKVKPMEFNRTSNFKEWMGNRTTSEACPPGFPVRKVQPSKLLALPSPSLKPQTRSGGQLRIKDEPCQGSTELPHDDPLTSAAQDWISPSNKIKQPFSSGNPKLHTEPPSLRPTPQPNPTPTTNTARMQLPDPSPNQDQGIKLLPKTSIPTRPHSFLKRKAHETEQSQKHDTPSPYTSMMKKSAENLLCHLCQAICSSALTMQQHLIGRHHKAKLEYMKMKRERATTTATRGMQGKPRCELCEIWCSNVAALDMHFKGKKHKSKVQEVQLRGAGGGQKSSKAPLICEVCSVPCMNQDLFEQHLKGRQHAAKQELKNRGFH